MHMALACARHVGLRAAQAEPAPPPPPLPDKIVAARQNRVCATRRINQYINQNPQPSTPRLPPLATHVHDTERLDLVFAHTPTYPDEPPLFKPRSVRGLSDAELGQLRAILDEQACACVCVCRVCVCVCVYARACARARVHVSVCVHE